MIINYYKLHHIAKVVFVRVLFEIVLLKFKNQHLTVKQ